MSATATMAMPDVNMRLMTNDFVLQNRPVFVLEIRSSEYPEFYIHMDPVSPFLLAGKTYACSYFITSALRVSMHSLDSPRLEFVGRSIASYACGVVRNYPVRGFYILVQVDMFSSAEEEKEEEKETIGSDVEGGGELDGGDDVCAVCLDGLAGRVETTKLRCSHVFHQSCIDRWIGYNKNSCPTCRSKICDCPSCN